MAEHYTCVRSASIDEVGRAHGALALAVFTYLCRRADAHGVSWPSYGTIATDLQLGRRTVINLTQTLVAGGFLHCEKATGPGDGPRSNRWTIAPQHRPEGVQQVHPLVQELHPLVQVVHPPSAGAAPKVNTTKKDIYPPVETPGFERFYTAYPKKQKRKEALVAWAKQKCEERADEIVTALTRQIAAGMFRKDPQYIPLPASWINNERWDDEVPAEVKGPGFHQNGRYVAG